MVKLRDAGKGAAYKIAPGVTAEEAEEAGLVVVEFNHSTIPPTPIYGKYITESGAALEITRPKDTTTEVVPAGGIPGFVSAGPDKGQLVNQNDPVVHGSGDLELHKDGADPSVDEIAAATTEAVEEGAYDPQNPKPKKK